MKIQASDYSPKTRIAGKAEPTSPRGKHWLELRACPLWGAERGAGGGGVDRSPVVLPWPLEALASETPDFMLLYILAHGSFTVSVWDR